MSSIEVVGSCEALVSPLKLAKYMGLTEGKSCNSKAPWFTVLVNGHRLTLPSVPIRKGVSWYALNQAQLVTGKVWTASDGSMYLCRLLAADLFSQVLMQIGTMQSSTVNDITPVSQIWTANVKSFAPSYAELMSLSDGSVLSNFYRKRLAHIGWIPVFELIEPHVIELGNMSTELTQTTGQMVSLIHEYTYCLEFRRNDQVIYTVEGSKEELVAFTEVLPKSLEGCEVRLTCKLVGSWSPYVDRDTIDTLLATSL